MRIYNVTEYGYEVKAGRISLIEDGYDGRSYITASCDMAITIAKYMTQYMSDGRIALAEVKALDVELPEGWSEEDVTDDNVGAMISDMDSDPDFCCGEDVVDERLSVEHRAAILEALWAHIDDRDIEDLIEDAYEEHGLVDIFEIMLGQRYKTYRSRSVVAGTDCSYNCLRVYDADGLYLGKLVAQTRAEAIAWCIRLDNGEDPVADGWQDAAGNFFDRAPYEGLPGEGSAVNSEGLAQAVSDYREYQTSRDWSVSLFLDRSAGTVWSRVEYGCPSISYRDPAIVELDPSEDATVAEIVSLAEELIREYREEEDE